jgi:hypothetical protein
MSINPVPRSERSSSDFATPYLELETQSISSLERTIMRELAQASHAAQRMKRKGGSEPASAGTSPVAQTRSGAVGGGKSVSM